MPPTRRVAIQVFEPFRRRVSQTWLRRAVLCALDVAYPARSCRLDVTVADDATVRGLNARFRGLDEVTDVLSFSTQHEGHWEGDDASAPASGRDVESFVVGRGTLDQLGEIIISLPQVERQAAAAGAQVERELALITVHGVLHLVGRDHAEADEQAEMQALERRALSAFVEASPGMTPRRARLAVGRTARGTE